MEGANVPGGPIEKQQVGAPLFGGQVMIWAKRWLGIEGAFALSPSMVAVTDSSGTADHTSTIMFASTRAIIPVTSRRAMWSFFIGAGLGLVHRSGTVWQYQSGSTAQTWILSFGGLNQLGPSTHVRFEFEDNISTAQFNEGLPTATRPRAHNDFMFVVALEFPIGHHHQ